MTQLGLPKVVSPRFQLTFSPIFHRLQRKFERQLDIGYLAKLFKYKHIQG